MLLLLCSLMARASSAKPLLEHRVAAREGDVGEGVAHDFLHQLVGRGHRAVADVPRLRIMAARTMVGASRTINGCAEARTVYHRIMYDA